jgi:hypothetical protein
VGVAPDEQGQEEAGVNRYYVIGTAAVVTTVLMILWPHFLPWFIGFYPTPIDTSPFYQFWSGFYIVVLSLATSTWLRKQNCHVRWCWRLGRFPVAEGRFYVCHHHHPDPAIRHKRVTMEHIVHVHKKFTEPGNKSLPVPG